MPNGLACAPLYFTKLLNPVFAHLRKQGHECFQYIDDTFIIADDNDKCTESVQAVSQLLKQLGFVVHPDKSVFIPSKSLNFLGFDLSSENMTITLSKEKEDKFLRASNQLLEKHSPMIREVAGLIGLVISYSHAFDYGLAHIKSLENEKIEALRRSKGNFDVPMQISDRARQDVIWWMEKVTQSEKHIEIVQPDVTVFTDASEQGWGAYMGDITTGGRWTYEESQSHINVLELKAIFFSLKSLITRPCQHVRIMTDNTTAMAYIKHMGGVRSLQCNEVAHEIWKWCEQRSIWLSIAHVPGVENVIADYKSRHFSDNVEWQLNPKLFERICQRFGEPTIDLFASRLNKQIIRYVSWMPDPEAVAVDAFSMSWTNEYFYAFPPFSCIARCIRKILEDKATGLLVVPFWPTQPWWARLINLNLPYMQIRPKKFNLFPIGKPRTVEFLSKCPLGVFHFLEECWWSKVLTKKRFCWLWMHGVILQKSYTHHIWIDGPLFASKEILKFCPLLYRKLVVF